MQSLHGRRRLGALLVAASLALPLAAAQAAPVLRVAYAGSMGVVMDRVIGPAFAKANHVAFQGIGQGAYGLARQIAGKLLAADVFVSITPGPIAILDQAGRIGPALPVASTQMVITYSPKSRFADQLAAAAAGRTPWYEVLQTPGLRFGRTDPAVDPQGQNIIFTLLLAQEFYHQPGLATKILGGYQNPRQIFAEPSLLSRLEAGQIDAASGYLSAALSHHLPVIRLPDQINLSDPNQMTLWYKTVQFAIRRPDGKQAMLHVQPLVFYATVLKDSRQLPLAEKFVHFLASKQGQKMFHDNGYSPPKGGPIR